MVLAAGLTGDQFVSLKQKLNMYRSEPLIRPELHITKVLMPVTQLLSVFHTSATWQNTTKISAFFVFIVLTFHYLDFLCYFFCMSRHFRSSEHLH